MTNQKQKKKVSSYSIIAVSVSVCYYIYGKTANQLYVSNIQYYKIYFNKNNNKDSSLTNKNKNINYNYFNLHIIYNIRKTNKTLFFHIYT